MQTQENAQMEINSLMIIYNGKKMHSGCYMY
jgi:hypothetical protein